MEAQPPPGHQDRSEPLNLPPMLPQGRKLPSAREPLPLPYVILERPLPRLRLTADLIAVLPAVLQLEPAPGLLHPSVALLSRLYVLSAKVAVFHLPWDWLLSMFPLERLFLAKSAIISSMFALFSSSRSLSQRKSFLSTPRDHQIPSRRCILSSKKELSDPGLCVQTVGTGPNPPEWTSFSNWHSHRTSRPSRLLLVAISMPLVVSPRYCSVPPRVETHAYYVETLFSNFFLTLGSQVYGARSISYICFSFSSYQIPAIGRLDDD